MPRRRSQYIELQVDDQSSSTLRSLFVVAAHKTNRVPIFSYRVHGKYRQNTVKSNLLISPSILHRILQYPPHRGVGDGNKAHSLQ